MGAEAEDDTLCCVCMDSPRGVVLIPCGHLVLCLRCAENGKITECPMCRQKIEKRQRVFF